MNKSFIPVLGLVIAVSGFLHYWEFRKISEFTDTFQIQSEIEVKRTALMLIQQKVIQNTVAELNQLKKARAESVRNEVRDSFPDDRILEDLQ